MMKRAGAGARWKVIVRCSSITGLSEPVGSQRVLEVKVAMSASAFCSVNLSWTMSPPAISQKLYFLPS